MGRLGVCCSVCVASSSGSVQLFVSRRFFGLAAVYTSSFIMSEFKVSAKQFEEAHNTFHLFDKKGDSTVATKGVGKLFATLALKIDGEKLKDWTDEMDEDATGFISWEQFKTMCETKLKEDEDERELKEAFRVLDKGNKGVIDVKDTDGSGTVDYEEFRTLMQG